MKTIKSEGDSVVVDLKPFSNPYTVLVLVIIVGLIGVGACVYFVFDSAIWLIGLLLVILGATAGKYGLTEFPEKPITGGALYLWNVPLMWGEHQIVVGGRTLLADYFPFYLSATPVDFTSVNKEFKITVKSEDDVIMEGTISITARPEPSDIRDFFQAGASMAAVFDQLKEIVESKAREFAKRYKHLILLTDGQSVGDELKTHLEEKSFGILIFKVRVVLKLPPEVEKVLQGAVLEIHQRNNEAEEYKTYRVEAQKLQAAFHADPLMTGRVPTLLECIALIKELRMIREGMTTGISNSPGGRTVAVVNPDNRKGSK